jgi:multiple sugar transport system permease protein/putative aldouronate transport system permease protein
MADGIDSTSYAELRTGKRRNGSYDRSVKLRAITSRWQLYLLVVIPIAYIIIFRYIPMYGAQIAFRKFLPNLGIWGSQWVGFRYFLRFFRSYNFRNVMINTLFLNVYQLVAGFPIPIILAVFIHYCPFFGYKKSVQMVTYAPHFISTVVMVGIIFKMLSMRNGIINVAITGLGIEKINFLGSPGWFPHVFVWTGIWQNMGWGTIIYLAALSGIDPELHESAKVDGATIWQRIWHIDIPGILPTVIILLILRTGRMLQVGFEKVFLMQNDLNISRSEVIQTFVYKVGLASSNPNFSYAAAIGLFISVISFILLLIVNRISKKVSETSLW